MQQLSLAMGGATYNRITSYIDDQTSVSAPWIVLKWAKVYLVNNAYIEHQNYFTYINSYNNL